jgi:hypothetical protein
LERSASIQKVYEEALVLGGEDEPEEVGWDLGGGNPAVVAHARTRAGPAGFGLPQEHERGERRIPKTGGGDLEDGDDEESEDGQDKPEPPAAAGGGLRRRAGRVSLFSRLGWLGGFVPEFHSEQRRVGSVFLKHC